MGDDGAWRDLRASLGSDRLSLEEPTRREYALPGQPLPRAVVRIDGAESLISTVRWAREHKTPLVPASSSAPHTQACLSRPEEAVVVDLSAMKRVIHTDRHNRVALVEAGVTFAEFVPVAGAHGLRAMVPLMPRRGKSMLASYLDREPTIYPKYQWDFPDPLLCLEVVYGTGDLFRTGSASGPGTIQEQWRSKEFQKSPMGPGHHDWMRLIQGAQGGIGIATWCSAKCEVRPQSERLFVAGADDVEPLVAASYRHFHRKLTDIHFLVDRNGLASLVAGTPEEFGRAAAAARPWNLVYSVSGIEHFPEERQAYLAREAEKEVRAQGAGLVHPPLLSEEELLRALLDPSAPPMGGSTPNGLGHWRDRPRGAHGSVYFQTTMDRVARLNDAFDELAGEAGFESERILRYVQPQVGGRACHVEHVVAANAADLEKTRTFCAEVAAPLIEAGAFFSRPHGNWARPAMEAAASSFWIYQKVKDIFDPDHILAPGRLMLGGRHAA